MDAQSSNRFSGKKEKCIQVYFFMNRHQEEGADEIKSMTCM